MKLVQLLLALYVVMLSALPCEALCRDEAAPLIADTPAPATEDCSDEEGCSPFCLCATCPGFNVPKPPQLVGMSVPDISILVSVRPFYQAPHAFDVPGRIWQPPRLS